MMSKDLIYLISSKIAHILNTYCNETNRKFPLKFFSLFENRCVPRAQIQELLMEFYLLVTSNHLEEYFGELLNKSIEHEILKVLSGFGIFIKDYAYEGNIKHFTKKDLKEIDFKNLYGISGDEEELNNLIKYLKKVKNHFKIILLDGSIGSRDYKPGWSDIDLFVIINNENFTSIKSLRKLRKITLNIRRIMMTYSILQLHGVYYSSESNMLANYNEFFPIDCLETGQILTDDAEIVLKSPSNNFSAYNYFKVVSNDFKNLYFKNKISQLSITSKILLFHRIYSFPFTFLQCMGYDIAKKASFDTLLSEFKNTFPDIDEFYKKANSMYYGWKINKLKTFKIRKFLGKFLAIEFLNRFFIRFEKEILNNINFSFDSLRENGLLDVFYNYLDISSEVLNKKNGSFQSEYKPYLNYNFYELTIRKVEKVFNKCEELVAIYQFGSVKAPGSSDIDLIFIVKDNISFLDKFQNLIENNFTINERFIIHQHAPFIIPESLAEQLNFMRICSNLKKISGNDITFKTIKDPYIKLAQLIELLIFTTPMKYPSHINRIEDIARPLQIINSIKYVLNLFLELNQELEMGISIKLTNIYRIIDLNDFIRKNMYFYNFVKMKRHINRSQVILKEFLLDLKLEISKFVEINVLRDIILSTKKSQPIFKFGRNFFISSEDSIININKNKGFLSNKTKKFYHPWAFYFFFQNCKFLNKSYFEGVNKRNSYLNRFLNYTTHYNKGRNLYVPFWYFDRNKIASIKLWNLIPYKLRKMKICYYYLWQFCKMLLLKVKRLLDFKIILSLFQRIKKNIKKIMFI